VLYVISIGLVAIGSRIFDRGNRKEF
jgi:hypothetical protein